MSYHYVVLPRLGYLLDVNDKVKSKTFDGPLVKETQLDFGSNYGQTVVQYKIDGIFSEITEIVHDIGVMETPGRELVLRIDTSLNSNSTLYTDDSGLEIMQRNVRFDSTEIVPANYHPMVQRVYMMDQETKSDLQLDIFTDSTHGAASLANGQIEIMLNRRCEKDDGRGVNQVLQDLTPIRTKMWMTLTGREDGAKFTRQIPLYMQNPPLITVVDGPGENFTLGANNLPENIHILNLRNFGKEDKKSFMARFHHIFAAGEHPLARPVKIDLRTALGPLFYNAVNITEYSLNTQSPIDQVIRYNWKTQDDGGDNSYKRIPIQNGVLVLQPLEIRTFVYDF